MTETTDTISLKAVTVAEDQTPRRAGLMHAFAEAEQIVSQLHAVPTDVTVKGDLVTGAYSVHLFYSRSTQGVREFAALFDADVASSPSNHSAGVYLEARTRYHGVAVQAWTVADQAPDPDTPREHTADEDPIAFSLTPEAEALRSCCAGPVCTCTQSSPQDGEYIPPADRETANR
ncbi:hypothetical protein [Streptomyces sp. NPDC004250]|uniref:hypothetical protein n=1 Tax=Streptomyces sp. NPDC004250 TaxID=3364692 RepID=UPI00367B51B9